MERRPMTHAEAIDVARLIYSRTEDMEAAIRSYIEARGLVLVPMVATAEMRKAGESWSGLPGQTWDDMLGAAPDPFEDGE